MTIYQGSRYQRSAVVAIKAGDAWRPTVFRGAITTSTTRGEIHAREFETFQHLAQRIYGDAEKWWVLADANPQILYPDGIPAGTVIRIP